MNASNQTLIRNPQIEWSGELLSVSFRPFGVSSHLCLCECVRLIDTRGRMRSDCLVLSDVAFGQRVVWSLFTGCRQLKPYFRNNYGSASFRIVFISSCNTLRSLVWLFYNDRRACRGVFSWPSYIWNQDGSHIWSSRRWILGHRCHGT